MRWRSGPDGSRQGALPVGVGKGMPVGVGKGTAHEWMEGGRERPATIAGEPSYGYFRAVPTPSRRSTRYLGCVLPALPIHASS